MASKVPSWVISTQAAPCAGSRIHTLSPKHTHTHSVLSLWSYNYHRHLSALWLLLPLVSSSPLIFTPYRQFIYIKEDFLAYTFHHKAYFYQMAYFTTLILCSSFTKNHENINLLTIYWVSSIRLGQRIYSKHEDRMGDAVFYPDLVCTSCKELTVIQPKGLKRVKRIKLHAWKMVGANISSIIHVSKNV